MNMRIPVSGLAAVILVGLASACGVFGSRPPETIAPVAGGTLQARGEALVDTAPKEDLRMVPPEVYMRTYLHLFGALVPLEAEQSARAGDGSQVFDTWSDYISALGFPDYRMDTPRQTQTNAIMIAAFERLGIALCDRALEHDWKGQKPVAQKDRIVFAFDPPKGSPDLAAFTSRFDVMHRTFLGYPASLAPTPRTARFFQLYRGIEGVHGKTLETRFTPSEAAWAAVCYGLVRHPEFHLY